MSDPASHTSSDRPGATAASVTNAPQGDLAPGDRSAGAVPVGRDIGMYLVGLVLAAGLTGVSFYLARSHLVWAPSLPVALSVLAIAQMGVHLVFFLHMTSGPDNVNNLMALAFGLLIVMLLVFGSLWIMTTLNHRMPPNGQSMQMQMQMQMQTQTQMQMQR